MFFLFVVQKITAVSLEFRNVKPASLLPSGSHMLRMTIIYPPCLPSWARSLKSVKNLNMNRQERKKYRR